MVLNQVGSPQVLLPDDISEEFVRGWFLIADREDPAFIGRAIPRVPVPERKRLIQAIHGMPKELGLELVRQGRMWAHLSHQDGTWPVGDMSLVYRSRLHTDLITEVAISSSNVRLVRQLDAQYCSTDEFWLRTGATLEEHLLQHVDKVAKVATIIADVMRSPLRSAVLSVINYDGAVEEIKACGPSALPPSQWSLPPGLTYLSEVQHA